MKRLSTDERLLLIDCVLFYTRIGFYRRIVNYYVKHHYLCFCFVTQAIPSLYKHKLTNTSILPSVSIRVVV